ncbi:MAG: 5-formyltetrahydrofolate cyclo-ligase [Candidatus Bilamarchaeaceae archaeon]
MKMALREEILAKRNNLPLEEQKRLSEIICANLIQRPHFIKAKSIAFYLAKGSEVDLRFAIEKAIEDGKDVLVPITNDHIEMVLFESFERLKPGRFGISEPIEKVEGPPPEVIIVPGVVFGLCMHRIGYGKGYYDRYLKTTNAYRIGVCYDFQLLDRLPSHNFDEPMDEIITEKRIIVKKF